MSKRLTDTNKYKKPFIRGLQGAYKLLWDYLYHDCDHAGIWIVDFEVAQVYLGQDMKVNKSDALRYFNNGEVRIIELENATKWFIVPFVEFQYGTLNDLNRAHNSVIQILRKYNIWDEETKNINKGLIRPLEGCKDKDKDIVKDIVKDKESKIEKKPSKISFTDFWDLYDKKRGDKIKLEKRWNELSKKDQEAIMLYIPEYIKAQPNKTYRKDPATFLNNRSWNDEIISSKSTNSVHSGEDPVEKIIRETTEALKKN
jgi:hypothetical protein